MALLRTTLFLFLTTNEDEDAAVALDAVTSILGISPTNVCGCILDRNNVRRVDVVRRIPKRGPKGSHEEESRDAVRLQIRSLWCGKVSAESRYSLGWPE